MKICGQNRAFRVLLQRWAALLWIGSGNEQVREVSVGTHSCAFVGVAYFLYPGAVLWLFPWRGIKWHNDGIGELKLAFLGFVGMLQLACFHEGYWNAGLHSFFTKHQGIGCISY